MSFFLSHDDRVNDRKKLVKSRQLRSDSLPGVYVRNELHDD